MAKFPLNVPRDDLSFLYGANASYLEALCERYLENPSSVSEEWQAFFGEHGDVQKDVPTKKEKNAPQAQKKPDMLSYPEWVGALDGFWDRVPSASSGRASLDAKISKSAEKQGKSLSKEEVRQAALDSIRAFMLIRAYRIRGHLKAHLDPLSLRPGDEHPDLDPQTYGFGPDDLDRPLFLDQAFGLEEGTLRELLARLHRAYCGTFGIEFMHISDPVQRAWLQERMEGLEREDFFSKEDRLDILETLIKAEGFEQFLHVKYTGTKRFGLDGGESVIPALEQILKTAGKMGVCEAVLGMAHRGRLNVLANVMSKPYEAIFHEFKGGSSTPEEVEGSGDVKYHLGSSSDRWFGDHRLHLSLTANPSHLEIVDPVVLGKVRAKQDQSGRDRRSVVPILIHGDAAFAGQGVVAECFGLSGLRGHRTGGSLHVIINNQIGFTTSPIWARSSPYPSDVAKMIGAPIFHVNGDDPESVAYGAALAMAFRQTFGCPVVIDVFCYRRFGHNESDEPSFTQPLMYRKISQHPTVLETYAQRLFESGLLDKAEFDARKTAFRLILEESFHRAETYLPDKADWLDGRWGGFRPASPEEDSAPVKTGVALSSLDCVSKALTHIPGDFTPHRTLMRVVEAKRTALETGHGLDWATAEALAFGTLLQEGFSIRLSGQDVQRGTFSQRHVVWTDQETERSYTPLNHIEETQKARIEAINSMLSEEAVLGFEYGYSLAEPNTLVLWEAQFGDFANGAQVVFDQFLSSGERKWLRMSGLVCLLPHGYEGQGPEHSSARLERFLQMCAEDNMQVANCSTPANYFHILRRQMHRDFRKPLIMMTPKSLLRHKRCLSKREALLEGTSFHPVLLDDEEDRLAPDSEIQRIILCSGKVYYDLLEERERLGRRDIVLLRVEQLYPFPSRRLGEVLSRFQNVHEVVWCQEEPRNMGAWTFVEPEIEHVLSTLGGKALRPRYAGRLPSAATAVGLFSKHQKELEAFLRQAFA